MREDEMEVVVDTNIVVAAILSAGMTRKLVFHPGLKLHTPDYLIEELAEHHEEFEEKAALKTGSFDTVLSLIMANVAQSRQEEYSLFEDEAKRISPDPDDFPFLALALSLKCPIWSNDRRLKKQKQVQVYDTIELVKMLQDGLL